MVAPTSSSRRGCCGPSCASSRSRQTTDSAPRSSSWRLVPPHISAIWPAQSARSLTRGVSATPCRAPFGRPAIPIDIAAFSYHWSALKIARLIFFFSGLACDSDFLALVDLEVLFFDIFHPLPCTPACILAGVPSRSQRVGHEAGQKPSSRPHHNHFIFTYLLHIPHP